MNVIHAKVSSKHQIVIPKDVRKTLDIQPQSIIIFLIVGDRVYLQPKPDSFTQKLRGLHAHVWRQPTEEWLEEERATWI